MSVGKERLEYGALDIMLVEFPSGYLPTQMAYYSQKIVSLPGQYAQFWCGGLLETLVRSTFYYLH
jgi:hypothetical protein